MASPLPGRQGRRRRRRKQASPFLKTGEALSVKEIRPEQHFTEPPPRYSEASLVKTRRTRRTGRPSTYALINLGIADRGYVIFDKKRFVAEPLGRIVSAFLVSFFEKYVEYGFTADLSNSMTSPKARAIGNRAARLKEFIDKIEEQQNSPSPKRLHARHAPGILHFRRQERRQGPAPAPPARAAA